jgi:hypothetical protein
MFSSRFAFFPFLVILDCRAILVILDCWAKIVFTGRYCMMWIFLNLFFEFSDFFIRRLTFSLIGWCDLTASGLERFICIKIKFHLFNLTDIRRYSKLIIVVLNLWSNLLTVSNVGQLDLIAERFFIILWNRFIQKIILMVEWYFLLRL